MRIIYLILSLTLLNCQTKKNEYLKKEKYITVESNLKLFVETFGESNKEACIFISGAGANSSFWSEDLCKKLVDENYFVIKYDHRDFGYSSKLNWKTNPYDFNSLITDVVKILDSLKIKKAHFIGHSMGGFIVQLVGINYPERVLSMTSISSSTNSPTVPEPPKNTWEIYTANKPNNDFENDLNGFLKVWEYLNGTAEFDKELAIKYTKDLYERQDINGALGETHVKSMHGLTDRTKELNKVKIPTLVMHGEEDYAMDKYGAIQTAESLKNSKLIIIPKMGHIPFNHEIKKQFEKEIIEFISEN